METDDVKGIIENHEQRIADLERLFKSNSTPSNKKISVKEFLLSKKPKDDVQRTLVIGYYLEKYKVMESFNVKDIEDGFRESKEKVPANINDKVNKNIQSGYITEAKEKKDKLKAWYLTNSGESVVENDLKKE